MVNNIQAVLLAAGSSRSSQTNTTKLAHKLCGQEMVLYPLSLMQELAISTTVVVGHQKDLIEPLIYNRFKNDVSCVYQAEQHGTGHAVSCAQHSLTSELVLIMNADTPLVTKDIIEKLIITHNEHSATISFVVAHNADPSGYSYGRLIHDHNGMHIVTSQDFSGDYHEHCLIDAGIYLIRKDFLLTALPQLTKCSLSSEVNLSDLVALANKDNLPIALTHASFDRIRSIDTLQDLWAAEHIKRSDLIRDWMSKGVRFTQPQTAHIDLGVTIGKDSVIGAGVHLMGNTSIGKGCTIREYTTIENAIIRNNVTILPHSIISNTRVASQSVVGPFAHLHEAEELKKSTATTTKTAHASFVGALKTTTTSHNQETP
jgi:bifunctional UDP-N-acetylglucosamine pyrophosphorylase/glucosamine-1-phosphate N-acetyltransferase